MRQITKFLAPTLAASVLLAACGSSSRMTNSSAAPKSAASKTSGAASRAVVKTASNSTLGGAVLVSSAGMTLYRLSGERSGKWICVSAACLQVWHPLAAQKNAAPGGSVGALGAVKRPDGTMQVTYKGMPLYTFAQDTKPGEAKGQGIKDVGTWNAVTANASGSGTPAPSTTSSSSSSGGGYGY